MSDPTDGSTIEDPFTVDPAPAPPTDAAEGAPPPMRIWPIVSPRVRKSVEEHLSELSDRHAMQRLLSALIASNIYGLSGVAGYLVLRMGLSLNVPPVVFGALYTAIFAATCLLAHRLQPKDPLEIYRESEFARTGSYPTGVPFRMPRWQRVLLLGPVLTVNAVKKLVEPTPPHDPETMEAALRLLPALHQPLPLIRAMEAGIGGPEVIRRATLLLNALGYADVLRDSTGELLLCPRAATARLLRDGS